MGFLVYLASFRADGVRRHYVGHTEAVVSERSALLRRRKWHLNKPPACMRGLEPASLELKIISRQKEKKCALSAEALCAAHWISRDELTRGGPWLLSRLSGTDKAEVAQVAQCSTERQVRALQGLSKAGHLYKHLQDKAFGSSRSWSPSGTVMKRLKASGCAKRKRRGLRYGSAAWEVAKWGSTDPSGSRTSAQDKYNNKRPDRWRS